MKVQLTAAQSRPARGPGWQRFEVRRIEDLGNAVFAAELDVVQMGGPRVRGSLAFAAHRGVLFSSGLIDGHAALSGPLSRDAVTIGVGLRFGPNSRVCGSPVHGGEVGVVLPGDRADALLTAGALYVAATLSARRLGEEAERLSVVLDRNVMRRSGLRPHPIVTASLAALTRRVATLHRHRHVTNDHVLEVGDLMLRAALDQCAPDRAGTTVGRGDAGEDRRAAVVARACRIINERLQAPLTVDMIADSVGSSGRILSRAFVETLGDTPAEYVRRLRLHRVRKDLMSPTETGRGFAAIAATWGLPGTPGMASRYREMFGELPGATRMAAQRRWQLENETL